MQMMWKEERVSRCYLINCRITATKKKELSALPFYAWHECNIHRQDPVTDKILSKTATFQENENGQRCR